MLNLIRLELRKHKFKGSLLGILIANTAIMLLICLMYFTEEFNSYQDMLLGISTFVQAVFTIYASVLIAKFVIDEYKNRTITLMFTYPVNRKKLITAKLLIVSVWTFVTIIVSNVLISSGFLVINASFQYIADPLELQLLIGHGVKVLFNAIAATGVSLIPLFFGMMKKSIPATIVSSIILASILNSTNGGFSISSIVAIPLTIAAVGVVITYFGFRNIEKSDVV